MVTSFIGAVNYGEYQTLFEEASPVTHVSEDDAPFLLIHGDKDALVPVEQSYVFRDALNAAGVPVKLVVDDGASHDNSADNPLDIPSHVPEIVDWFERHLVTRGDAYN